MSLASGCGKRNRAASEESKDLDFRFEKVLETSDDSGSFYFKYPDNSYYGGLIRADDRGDIYVRDSGRILKFSGSGEFIKNLMQEGQGPGEITNLKTFLVTGNKLIIYNSSPPKIILKNMAGSLIEEFRIGKKPLNRFLAFHNGRYYFSDSDAPEIKGGEAKIIDIFHYLIEVSPKGEVKKIENFSFPIKTFVVSQNGAYGMIDVGELIVTPTNKGNYFFVSHTPEYSLKLWDVDKKAVIKTIKKPYERRKPPLEIAEKINRQAFQLNDKLYRPPPPKYLNDIRQLLVYRDKMWVVTSTVDKEKGILIDVYDSSGDYSGKFYLKLPGRLKHLDYYFLNIFVYGDYLYTIERDAEDNPWLVKYRIIAKS